MPELPIPTELSCAIVSGASCPLWVARYDGAAGHDRLNDIALSPDDATLVGAGETQRSGLDFFVVALDSRSGGRSWTFGIASSSEEYERAESVVVNPVLRLAHVSGVIADERHAGDVLTATLDLDSGALRWARVYAGLSRDFGPHVAVTADGSRVLVAATSDGLAPEGTSRHEVAVVAYEASSGAQLWERRWHAPIWEGDFASRMAISPSGDRVYVGGFSSSGVFRGQAFVLALDGETGAVAWSRLYGDPADFGKAAHLVTSGDGARVFVVGRERLSVPVAMAVDASDGRAVWTVREHARGGFGSVALAPGDRSVVAAGNVGVRAYEAESGALRWTSSTPAYDVELSPQGRRVFAVATEDGGLTAFDCRSVAFEAADGSVSWSARFRGFNTSPPQHGSQSDVCLAVESAGDGRIFAGGRSFSPATLDDALVVAYLPSA